MAYLALCIEAEHIKEQQFTNFSSYQFLHSPKCSSTYHSLLYSYEIISYSHINYLSMQITSSIFPIMLRKTDIWQDQINQRLLLYRPAWKSTETFWLTSIDFRWSFYGSDILSTIQKIHIGERMCFHGSPFLLEVICAL